MATSAHTASRFISSRTGMGFVVSTALLLGYCESSSQATPSQLPVVMLVANNQPVSSIQELPRDQDKQPSDLWAFPSYNRDGELQNSQELISLPKLEEVSAVDESSESAAADQEFDDVFVAQLLPPQPLGVEQLKPTEQQSQLPVTVHTEREATAFAVTPQATPPALVELTQQEQLLNSLANDSTSAVTGVLTDRRVNDLAKSKIQNAYAMASRGSHYVARQELVEVMRMISQAKDALQSSAERSKALAAGLRALREAEDFAPRGTQLEAELDIAVLCASHRTPIAKQADAEKVLPRVMMDRYLRYAQLQLAMSVAGEPAGSMALHALGKLHRQLGAAEPDKHRLADRRAIAYQQAALLAHNQNHLAAHELGVLLAKSGHFTEAHQLLLQVAAREPNAIVYRNLARVQEQLGQQAQALANRDIARQLSQQGATGTNNVQWVSPTQFAQASVPTPRFSTAQRPMTNQLPLPGSRQAPPAIQRR